MRKFHYIDNIRNQIIFKKLKKTKNGLSEFAKKKV